MKTIVLRLRAADKEIFDAIKTGNKKVETRAATKKYKNIQAGDIVVFVCDKKKFRKTVKRVRHFRSVSAMLKVYKVKDIMPKLRTKKELEAAYHGYPHYREKIKRSGLVALEFK